MTVICDGLRPQIDARQEIESAMSVHVLNRMQAFERPASVRVP